MSATRPLKFRAIATESREWVFGSYVAKFSFPDPTGITEGLIREHAIVAEDGIKAWQVIPETVGQFTDKKDRTGSIDVYEGDIDQYGCVVEYYDAAFILRLPSSVTYRFLQVCNNIELTSTIHDKFLKEK